MATTRQLESSLEDLFQKQIRRAGGLCIKLAPTTIGIPDRLVLMPEGRIYLVELKAENGTVSQIQHHVFRRIRRLGIPVYVLKGRSEVYDWVEGLSD